MASDDEPVYGYGPESIEVLEGLEAVRRRPGMYVGDTSDGSGVHHLLWEVVGNAIDEHLAGHAHHIHVRLEGDTVTVEDDGRGIPVEPHPSGRSALEVVMTQLHAGPTRDGHTPHVHIGQSLHGVGLAAVNALSDPLEVIVHRGGRRFAMAFARGDTTSPLRDLGPSDSRGTQITLRPDPTIFGGPGLDPVGIREHLRELAYFNPAVTLGFNGERFHEPRGLAALVLDMAGIRDRSAPVIRLHDQCEDVRIDLAFLWANAQMPRVRSFVCQRATEDGGTHVEGLRQGFSAAMQTWRPELATLSLDQSPGFVGAVHVGLYDPRFGGPTKACLADDDARRAVRRFVADTLPGWLDEHPEHARMLALRLERAP